MNELFIDTTAIRIIKEEIIKENAEAVRIFVAGGGCCPRLEIAPVNNALAGDVTWNKGGITIYIEKHLADITSSIYIRFDEQRGLLVDLNE
jgi:Fe-S cluster assembly iron-binding protein IscA